MMKGRYLKLAVIFGVTLLGGLLEGAAERPNILFLISDDQRADTISALGNKRISTPNLDALVERGVTFTRAVCANPICVASRAEILTGNSGFRNGIIPLPGLGRLQENMPSWPRTLMDAGYETCYVGKWHTTGRPSTWGYTDTIGLFSGGGGKWMKPQKDWKGFEVTGYKGWIFQTDD
ncbi:MAG: sulfatase, partial [Verrucomicrobiales bacterium]